MLPLSLAAGQLKAIVRFQHPDEDLWTITEGIAERAQCSKRRERILGDFGVNCNARPRYGLNSNSGCTCEWPAKGC